HQDAPHPASPAPGERPQWPAPTETDAPQAESGLESMERQMIEETLSRLGNKKLAAQALGIGIATLYRKIKKYEIA
ncbi:helix-turn-helix domain-containing protein, partial [Aeromonas schubertii]|uniref:helix-turn-helix domain-containing protein n=1 Tax=Aeromonas schubertii TaxID=652 RepID=UPI0038B5CF77